MVSSVRAYRRLKDVKRQGCMKLYMTSTSHNKYDSGSPHTHPYTFTSL